MNLNQFAWEGDDFHTPGVCRIIGTIASGAMQADAAGNAANAQSKASAAELAQYRAMFDISIGLNEPFRQGGLWALEQLIGTEKKEGRWEYSDGSPVPPELIPPSVTASKKEREIYFKRAEKHRSLGFSTDQPRWVEPTQASEGMLGAGGGAPKLDFDSFKDSPWYTLQRDEGIRALESSAAGSGMLQSGNTGKALMNYGSDYAYGKALDVHNTETNDWINTQLNPLLAVLGAGQVSAGQSANNAIQSGGQMGDALRYGGEAKASGYLGQAAAYKDMFSGINQSAGTALGGMGMAGMFSSRELKQDIESLDQRACLNKVCALRGVGYKWIHNTEEDAGLIAEELEEIIPEAVVMIDGYKGVKPLTIIGYLVESIKQVNSELNDLKLNLGGS